MNGGSIASQYIGACMPDFSSTIVFLSEFRFFRPNLFVEGRSGGAEPRILCICGLYSGKSNISYFILETISDLPL
jgi:hypothetical protein